MPGKRTSPVAVSLALGVEVYNLRMRRCWTQMQLVDRLRAAGWAIQEGEGQTVRRIEKGENNRAITVDELLMLAEVFDVEPAVLLAAAQARVAREAP